VSIANSVSSHLLSRCCAGGRHLCDECGRFFRHIWQLHPRIVRFLRRDGADGTTADDLAAEALVVAWRRLDEVPSDTGEAVRWLQAVARNLHRNHRRSIWRERRRRERLGAHLATVASPPQQAADQSDRLLGLEAWRSLPVQDAELLRLVVESGPSLEELQHRFACSRSTAAMRVWRARDRLRSAMSA
jgi:RNA polymerase sigma factor (sigma-70 family)